MKKIGKLRNHIKKSFYCFDNKIKIKFNNEKPKFLYLINWRNRTDGQNKQDTRKILEKVKIMLCPQGYMKK